MDVRADDRAPRRRRASAPRLRDRHHRLRGRGRAPRLLGRRRPDRAGRRAVDDGRVGGIVHEEFHGRDFARRGGAFEMVQLWVNLPARHKMAPPRYQSILSSQIPSVSLPETAGNGARHRRRVRRGDAVRRRPSRRSHVWDLRLDGDRGPRGCPTAARPRSWCSRATLRVNGSEPIGTAEVGLLRPCGDDRPHRRRGGPRRRFSSRASRSTSRSSGSGPFVMNTAQEIRQAMADYQSGKMGHLP